MADLIKKIKIKKQDGTFTDYIPIGAEAQNISTNDGDSVQLKLNKKPYYYNNIVDMKTDTKLKVGDMAITLGYYEPNDGGAGEYKIVNGTYVDDGGSYHQLNNNLFAELIIKEKINAKQFGAYGDGVHDDTLAIQNAIDYKYTEKAKTIFFPVGDYCVSHLDLTYTGTESKKYVGITLEGENYKPAEDMTLGSRLISIDETQSLIKAGHLGTYSYPRMLFGLTVKNLILDGNTNRATYGLELYLCSNLLLENLHIKNFSTSGVLLEDCYDSLIDNCQIVWCGAIDNSTPALDLHGNKKTTNAIRITNCRLENNYYSLFLGGHINQIMITNTKFERGGIGAGMEKMIVIGDVMGEVSFVGCVFTTGSSNYLIQFLPYSSYHNWRLTNFIGCIFTSAEHGVNGGCYLDLTNAKHVSISSCTFARPNINNSEHTKYSIILGDNNNLVNNIFEITSGSTSDNYYGIVLAGEGNVITNNHFNSTNHKTGPTLVVTGGQNIIKNNYVSWSLTTPQQYGDWISFSDESNMLDYLRETIYNQPSDQAIRANNSKIINFTTNRTITKTDIINNFSGCELILKASHANGLIFTRANDFLPELSSASYTLPMNSYMKIVRINGVWHVENIILPSSIS